MTVIAAPRFEITAIQADIAGTQSFTLDAHITTRGHNTHDVLTVTLGAIVFYCHDGHSVRAFARAWATALTHAGPTLPELAAFTAGPGHDRHHAGIILRVAGAPTRKPAITVIPTAASPTGLPHAQVTIGRLSVHAHDLAAIRSWADGWAGAKHTANRLWPDPDTFDTAENTERNRIARTGTLAGTTTRAATARTPSR